MRISQHEYPPNEVIAHHAHPRATLSIVLHGDQLERVGDQEILLGPLSVDFKPARLEHENVIGGAPVRAVLVEFAVSTVPATMAGRSAPEPDATLLAARVGWALARTPARASAEVDRLVTALAPDGVQERAGPAWLVDCRAGILARPDDHRALSELARDHSVHPVHLARSFRRRFGCTVGEFRRRASTACAARWISGTDRPLAAIAARCGFADQSHLTRVFRHLVGTTPAAFRAAITAGARQGG